MKKIETVCKTNMCSGCMACFDSCQHKAIMIKDSISAYNAVIDSDLCVGCNICRRYCQFNNEVLYMKPITWYQGWALDTGIRENSSSGGVATALIEYFSHNIGEVCSCIYSNGQFIFKFYDKERKSNIFSGSKYVKSNPQGIYKAIKEKLEHKRKVLFIGLPCQVAALKLFTGEKHKDLLYTADLICHGTPSPLILEYFLNEYGYSLNNAENITFRKKDKFYLDIDQNSIFPISVQDLYIYSFLNGLIYTENCYRCKYARMERISDVTLGDSWGSELSEEEQKRGISLVLCQTEKGKDLILQSRLRLMPVDINRAMENNAQLNRPVDMPRQRKKFFEMIEKKSSFNKAIAECYPRIYIKKRIKVWLVKLGFQVRGKGIWRSYTLSFRHIMNRKR